MNTIKFECPHCHQISEGDESFYGRQVNCPKCQGTILVPERPSTIEPKTARLVQELPAVAPASNKPEEEIEIFKLTPVARAFLGSVLLGLIFIGLGAGLAIMAPNFAWPPWVGLIPAAPGLLVLLIVWIRMKSYSYRLTNQRLFFRRGLLAKNLNELELYRVKDVLVDQGFFQRLLGYGTITVVSADETTPRLDMIGISQPVEIKELIRTHYRSAREREGVRPTEFMQSS